MIRIKSLKTYTLLGILFVLVTGTISHFIYEWSGNLFFAGLIFPVNESVWEHMKLVFFPMLLYSVFMKKKLSSDYPCIESALAGGILSGTLMVPVLFYTYSGVLGFDLPVLDILTFAISVIIGFYVIYKTSSSCILQKYSVFLSAIVGIFFLCFIIFSISPLKLGIFSDPSSVKTTSVRQITMSFILPH